MKPVDPQLLRASRPARLHLIATGLLAVCAAGVIVAQAALLARVIARGAAGAGLGELTGTIVLLAVVLVARAAIDGSFDALGRFGAARVMSDLRGKLAAHVLVRRPGVEGQDRAGALSALAVQGVDAVEPYFARFLPQLALAAAVPLTVLVLVLPRDWISALIMILTLPLIPFFMALVGWATEAQTEKRWRTLTLLSAHFLDVVRGLPTLRAHVRDGAQARQMEDVGDRYRRETMATLRIAFLSALVLELLAMISTALVAGEIGVRLQAGKLGLEDGLFVLLLAPELYMPLRQVGAQFHASADGLETAGALREALATPPSVQDRPGAVAPVPDPTTEPIVFERVSFSYPGRDLEVLDGVDLRLEPAVTTALVGPSGSGKSTLAALLLRLADPGAGTIRCGTTDLRDVALADWRSICAYLPQRARIYAGSVAENLRLGRPGASEDELWDALRAAGAGELVNDLPDGLETRVGEGGRTLSAGESQRIAIARAFVRDAPLLVLDEPSAHLDEESAAVVDAALDRLRNGRTTLLVVHRPALAARADRVLRVAPGGVVTEGAPA
ncbi:MAG: thiol reductant ABC exporter subunit CydD [Baekduia sp.]